MEAAAAGASVEDLAAEVLLHIMSFLCPGELVRAEAVQRAWANLIKHDEPTWRTTFRTHFGQGPQPPARGFLPTLPRSPSLFPLR